MKNPGLLLLAVASILAMTGGCSGGSRGADAGPATGPTTGTTKQYLPDVANPVSATVTVESENAVAAVRFVNLSQAIRDRIHLGTRLVNGDVAAKAPDDEHTSPCPRRNPART